MKWFNFTVIFIIAIVIIGLLGFYIYEHYRYSPFALLVDVGVAKEYLRDRHVDLWNPVKRDEIIFQDVDITERLSTYEFALKLEPVLSKLDDGITRIEIPLKSTDKVLPMSFKLVDGDVIVYKSKCEIPVGSKILTMNGYQIKDIIEKYRDLIPNLDEPESEYAFVDKLLYTYPNIIDGSTIHITYYLPNSRVQRTAYVKAIDKEKWDAEIKKDIENVKIHKIKDYTVLRILGFEIFDKKQMTSLLEAFGELNDATNVIFDLRYASDGDNTIPTIIISKLITSPTELYPRYIGRFRNREVEKKQIPIEPDEHRIDAKIYFLVNNTCFYQPQKTLITFVNEHKLGNIIAWKLSESITKGIYYTDEFWKILPNTRTYVVMPQGRVEYDANINSSIGDGPDIGVTEIIDDNSYLEWLKNFIAMLESKKEE
ncbi:MAG: hypothetical protein ACUVQF_05140 [Fervidobacterium sp.]|uniref:hypothetical protein n=1 Tax=Fervidobacterium sp. TaxID=1871331 RepID=UPI004049D08D